MHEYTQTHIFPITQAQARQQTTLWSITMFFNIRKTTRQFCVILWYLELIFGHQSIKQGVIQCVSQCAWKGNRNFITLVQLLIEGGSHCSKWDIIWMNVCVMQSNYLYAYIIYHIIYIYIRMRYFVHKHVAPNYNNVSTLVHNNAYARRLSQWALVIMVARLRIHFASNTEVP